MIAEFPYTHPIINVDVREMQNDIYNVNEGTRVKLCGSYFHAKRHGVDQIGSHEAGLLLRNGDRGPARPRTLIPRNTKRPCVPRPVRRGASFVRIMRRRCAEPAR